MAGKYQIFKNDSNKFGIKDKDGKTLIEPIYDEIKDFKNGFAVIKQGDKYGFLSETGEELNQFPAYIMFKKDDKTGKMTTVDVGSAKSIPCIYDEVKPFLNGLANVKKDGKWGYINIAGEEVLPCDQVENTDIFERLKENVDLIKDLPLIFYTDENVAKMSESVLNYYRDKINACNSDDEILDTLNEVKKSYSFLIFKHSKSLREKSLDIQQNRELKETKDRAIDMLDEILHSKLNKDQYSL